MPVRRSSRVITRSARRKLVWATLNTGVSVGAGAVKGFDLLGNLETAGASVLGATVMRTHYQLGLNWNTPVVNDFWCIGQLICRDVDITTGIDPNTNPGDDWMLSKQYYVFATGAAFNIASYHDIDLKSKRKVQELEQRCGLMVANHSATARNVNLYVRTLVALP